MSFPKVATFGGIENMSDSIQTVEVIKVKGTQSVPAMDALAVEEPLEIRLGERSLSVTMRTPGHDVDLAIGFLFTEGIICGRDEVAAVGHLREDFVENRNVVQVDLNPTVSVNWNNLQRNFYTTSSCGVCGKSSIDSIYADSKMITSNLVVNPELVASLPPKLRESQDVFDRTGGIHAAAAFGANGNLTMVREDVGRHNALDKVIGGLLSAGTSGADQILLVSGRASFELVQKAAVAGFPIMVAVGAPSSFAVALAKEVGMTLIGFLRVASFNIYCGEERVAHLSNRVKASHS